MIRSLQSNGENVASIASLFGFSKCPFVVSKFSLPEAVLLYSSVTEDEEKLYRSLSRLHNNHISCLIKKKGGNSNSFLFKMDKNQARRVGGGGGGQEQSILSFLYNVLFLLGSLLVVFAAFRNTLTW